MTLGEILTGARTYFPLPVAYGNDRRPIIPAQLGRPLPVAAASGMGSYLDETTTMDAVAQPAKLLGVPATGIALIVGGAFLYGFLTTKKTGRRRR